ncbi:hypothetical protein KOR42_25320 [Thalassoglobus neptunius]|uniref:DUF427 domain-containing protein n=1 Tax=Thalassoglobus neptunius TaxID=1938619 RepID=A0A5C5XA01_9PLAN|nr:DUF427 domain-containing protein [Thalassoglobus neptunius]TWT59143.1 hypothetical protein KOR42_25320 [Thalassoglobus neptunius]
MKAIWKETVIADSDETVVVDGNHYFPAESVNMELMKESSTQTVCGWKGTASHYSIQVGDETNENAAWYYPDPKAAAENIKGRVAFWKGVQIVDE